MNEIIHFIPEISDEIFVLKSYVPKKNEKYFTKGYLNYLKSCKMYIFKQWRRRIEIFKRFRERNEKGNLPLVLKSWRDSVRAKRAL